MINNIIKLEGIGALALASLITIGSFGLISCTDKSILNIDSNNSSNYSESYSSEPFISSESSSTNTFTFLENSIIASNEDENGYKIEGTKLTIDQPGVYIITGSCDEGSVKVKKEVTGVTLILKDLSLTCSTTAPIAINKSSEATIEIIGTVNLVDKEDANTEETNEDFEGACIKVKSGASLKIIGDGTLNIDGSNCKNGIKGGATSNITIDNNITFNIKVANNALSADGSMVINGGTFNIEAKDGVKCDPDDDDPESIAELTINGGTFNINVSDDGVRANGKLEINGGSFDITSTEGIEATYVIINDGDILINATDDGINASNKSTRYSPKVEINGGNITIKMGPGDTDAIDANGELVITGGTIDITAQSAFDYDKTVTFTGGDITVNGQKITTISNSMIGGGRGNGGRMQMPQEFDPNAERPTPPSGDFRNFGGERPQRFNKSIDSTSNS